MGQALALKVSSTALLILQGLLVVTGGLVRLTGSGLGCPTWPKCTNDSYVPVKNLASHGLIEFGNRLLTFALFAGAISLFIAVVRNGRDDLKIPALLQIGGIFGQGVLGGITVLTKLNPIPVAGHLLLSMLLIAGATSIYIKREAPLTPIKESSRIGIRFAASSFLVLIAGTVVTGSGPHAGDWQAKRFPILLQNAVHIHEFLVAANLIFAIYIAWKFPRKSIIWFLGAIAFQSFIGLLQWYQGLPQGLVALHLLGATLFWYSAWRVRLSFKFQLDEAKVKERVNRE